MGALRLSWIGEPERCLLQPPVSKSHAIRLLMLRHARGEPMDTLQGPLPDDVGAVQRGLAAIGSGDQEIAIDAGLGGAPLRFMLALASMTPGLCCTLDAAEPLRNRPLGPLVTALKSSLVPHGLNFDDDGWPLKIDTRTLALPERIDFSLEPASSQYLSGLALASAAALAAKRCREVTIGLTCPVASPGYAALTAGWMQKAGFELQATESSWKIDGFVRKPWNPDLPSDWSSAAYLLVWAWKTGGKVRVTDPKGHPDGIVLDILSRAGLDTRLGSGGVVKISGRLKRGLRAGAWDCPDLVPTLGVLALAAPKPSVFEGIGILSDKESDRLRFLLDIAKDAGGRGELRGDTLTVHPAETRGAGVVIRTEDDHRRAMAGSLLVALGWPEVVIDEPACVSKSFPGFWDQIRGCGVHMERL